ncbi:HNH endonuclease [Microbacterium sp.]|uniref:HNH endonuclease n=1 Tax=Microbacterium sp. TaxID=51671 RepID=UPI0027350085|nr:HNH endonuclease [Microbacterium sp.]MDP3952616.1 HNH endonuclease [Microbacterium sp.]
MPVSKRLRFEIFRRDNHTCRYCGSASPDVPLTIDHVVPVALGGNDEPSNLVTACTDCNAGKSSSNPDAPIVDDVEQNALLWSRAMERAAQIQAAQRERFQEYVDAFDDRWERWTNDDEPMPLPSDYTQSLHRFFVSGFTEAEVVNAIEVAMNASGVRNVNLFRYFCGICYRRLEERQEIARDLLEGVE